MKSDTIARHKRRLDRGGVYWNYLSMVSTGAILARVFNITDWWVYVIGFIGIITFRYVSGYIEDKKGILSAEQQSYSDQNPFNIEVLKQLKEINESLSNRNNVQ